MDRRRFVIEEPEDFSSRLDQWLAHKLQESRSLCKKLIDDGHVLANGQPAKPSLKLEEGMVVEVEIPPLKSLELIPVALSLNIFFEDEHLAFVEKPAGIATHPAPTYHGVSLVEGLLSQLKELSGIGGVARPGIVHRLDEPVSGVLVVAKTDEAHQGLSHLFANHDLIREYVGIVSGKLPFSKKTVDTRIGRHPRHRQKMAVLESGGKQAITHMEVINRGEKFTKLLCRLETGRTHQIRVHCQHLKAPIVGDVTYGSSLKDFSRIMLHARRLALAHPVTGELIDIISPEPAEFGQFFRNP